MGSTKFKNLVEFLNDLKKKNGSNMDFDYFRKEMMMRIGSDRRTLRDTIQLINDFKLAEIEDERITIK